MDYEKRLSQCAQGLKPSGIRRFFDLAATMEGVISLGVGEPDFKTPYAIRRAGIESLEKGRTFYTANAGLAELRRQIAAYLERRFGLTYDGEKEILVTVGGSEAIDLCVRACVDPGDEVLIPEPCFVCYDPITRMVGGVPVVIATRAEEGFRLTPEALEAAITPRTKLLVLPYPNNPTGAVLGREELEGLAQVLRRHPDIFILSDEIYAELTYTGKHVSIASLPGMRERTVVVNGFSKAYAMTGWRLGYAAAPREIYKVMLKLHQFAIMCAPTMSQYAAIEAMKSCDDEIERMAIQFGMRRGLMVSSLNRMGLTCADPQGTFYVFPSIRSTGMTSGEFCEALLTEQKVAVVPGDAFGQSGEGYVRISYSYSVDHLIEALRRIELFLEAHR